MSTKPTDELFDHEYDGIQEYDNPVPGWVNAILLGTVVYSIFHVVYVEFGPGMTVAEEYSLAVQQAEEQMAKAPQNQVTITENDLAMMVSKADVVAEGKKTYDAYCVACHAAEGEGQIGPNLTDDFWIHGNGSLMSIRKVIKEGVLDKGMPAWEMQLSPDELNQVSAFVGTIRGSNKPGKAPEGDYVDPASRKAAGSAKDEDGETASL